MSETTPAAASASRPWYQRIGPGLITACVVIGPGSIMTSSKTGATYGYSLSWIVVVAVLFMLVYTALGAKIGVVSQRSMGDLVRERAGRPLAILIGLGVFFIAAAFQFGNNLGVHSAVEQLMFSDEVPQAAETVGDTGTDVDAAAETAVTPAAAAVSWTKFVPVMLFNALSIAFVFFAKNLYRVVERLMMGFVALMLLSFAVNLIFAGPDLGELAMGFVPTAASIRAVTSPSASDAASGSDSVLVILGLVGTTFVVAASFYQSYLVRQKGWNLEQLKDGLLDVRIGAAIMALITLMIMATSAASLRGQELGGVGDVAQQLRPLFGDKGLYLFCLGLFSAAYSSFIVNSMIGGFILSDGLGLGSKPDDLWTRLFTVLVLVTGMGVALYVVHTGVKPVPAIVAAQAVTVIAAPLMAGTILWLSNRKDIMGEHTNGLAVNIVAGIGFLVLLAMAGSTAFNKVLPAVQGWLDRGAA
jgi:manganese transport protein